MMWRRFDVPVPFKVVLENQSQDFVGPHRLQHLAVNTSGLDFWSLSQEAHQHFFKLTCVNVSSIMHSPVV